MRQLIGIHICYAVFNLWAFADTTDIFPLRIGLRCLYEYYDSYTTLSESDTYWTSDSGTVEYTVIGSSPDSDSSITWQILQSRDLVHLASYSPIHSRIIDSVHFTINESTSGYHELHCNSLIWSFPLSLQLGDTTPVYRYADTSRLQLRGAVVWHCYGIVPPFTPNSAFFARDSGLTYMERFVCETFAGEGFDNFTVVTLLSWTITDAPGQASLPAQLTLLPNYPNPFNATTTIGYELPSASDVVLSVYDVLGSRVIGTVQHQQPEGHYTHFFDGSHLASGIYIVRLQALGATLTNKMVLLK
jgi:hypothetical protein